ncbi:putative magnesium transporter NIPA [Helianthus annuus]|nr:putative magnesium transporter NIPA [Helianthus annuus]
MLSSNFLDSGGDECESYRHCFELTLSGMNKLVYPQTWAFSIVVLLCIITKMFFF